MVIDIDSTITELHGHHKSGAAYGYTRQLGYHPLVATLAGTGEVLHARMRKGSASSGRGVVRFAGGLIARVRRAGATEPITVRADSGFWSWKLIDTLDRLDAAWSITVTRNKAIQAAIATIPESSWVDIDYTIGGRAQVAECNYTAAQRGRKRTVRLVVCRTRLVALWSRRRSSASPQQTHLWWSVMARTISVVQSGCPGSRVALSGCGGRHPHGLAGFRPAVHSVGASPRPAT